MPTNTNATTSTASHKEYLLKYQESGGEGGLGRRPLAALVSAHLAQRHTHFTEPEQWRMERREASPGAGLRVHAPIPTLPSHIHVHVRRGDWGRRQRQPLLAPVSSY